MEYIKRLGYLLGKQEGDLPQTDNPVVQGGEPFGQISIDVFKKLKSRKKIWEEYPVPGQDHPLNYISVLSEKIEYSREEVGLVFKKLLEDKDSLRTNDRTLEYLEKIFTQARYYLLLGEPVTFDDSLGHRRIADFRIELEIAKKLIGEHGRDEFSSLESPLFSFYREIDFAGAITDEGVIFPEIQSERKNIKSIVEDPNCRKLFEYYLWVLDNCEGLSILPDWKNLSYIDIRILKEMYFRPNRWLTSFPPHNVTPEMLERVKKYMNKDDDIDDYYYRHLSQGSMGLVSHLARLDEHEEIEWLYLNYTFFGD